MASAAISEQSRGRQSSQFIITLDPSEKARWKSAADAAGVSMAEYVRRAVQTSEFAPSADEIAAARRLAGEINASVDRMEAMLDRTLERINDVIDPVKEADRRTQILAELEASGAYLDLDALARSLDR
jgi:hypothetical protein